jgi:hypothetical protein
MMFSTSGFIVGEDRDPQRKEVTFFCLNAADGSVLWNNISVGEPWWVGIEAIAADRIFLHGFRTPDMPEHARVICLDLGTGKELWRYDEYSFACATGDSVVLYRDLFGQRRYHVFSGATGELMQDLGEPPADLHEIKRMNHGRTDLTLPELVSVEEDPQGLYRRLTRRCNLTAVVGPIEAATYDGTIVASYHVSTASSAEHGNPMLRNLLVIVAEKPDAVIFEDVLNAATPAVVPDSFFLDGSMLYFMKERSQIVALDLARQSR